jgi:hypothetical protein
MSLIRHLVKRLKGAKKTGIGLALKSPVQWIGIQLGNCGEAYILIKQP